MPTRLDTEETEVISINSSINSESESDYVPHSPMYEPGSPRPEPVEEAPEAHKPEPSRQEGAPNIPNSARTEPSRAEWAPNMFTDSRKRASNGISARPRVLGRGIPVQCVAPFFWGTGHRRYFLGRMRPM